MLKNYLRVALRTLRKHKGYSFINVAGLGLGLACFALILIYVQDERSFDRFHENAERVYRVVIDAQPPSGPMDRFAVTSRPIGRTIRAEYPEAESVLRMAPWDPILKHDNQYFYDDDVLFAEPSLFDVFTFPLLEGDARSALSEPNTAVITASMRDRYFGGQPALGRTLTFDDTLEVRVTGVMEDVPTNSHFTTDFFVSFATLEARQPEGEDWLNLGAYTYVLLQEGASGEAFEAKIRDLMHRKWGETLEQIGFAVDLRVQRLTDIHLQSDRQAELGANGDVAYVWIFSAVALFVLLIACINFMNLATARSMERAKEVGLRKVVGSSRKLLVAQFLSESVLLCLLSLVIAAGLIAAAWPFFDELTGKELAFSTLLQPGYVLSFVGIALVAGLLAGTYPALFLSSFPMMDVLRGTFRTSRKGVVLRKGLVVVQFTLSVALVTATLVVLHQLRFMQTQDLGFEKEQVIVVPAQGLPGSTMAQQSETVKAEFGRHPAVRSASASAVVPGRGTWVLIYGAEGLAENDSRRAQVIAMDDDYAETYGLELVAGRDLSDAFETDVTAAALLNETAVESIGWASAEEALGKTLDVSGTERTVVGVIRDYHHSSLQQAVEPMILLSFPNAYNYFSLRAETDDVGAVLTHLEETWTRLFPGHPFDSFFLDEDYARQYEAEQRLTRVFGTFAFFTVLIACLGLFGLASFTAEQRTKEIGVRKVLGATVPGIVMLLSKEFAALVVAAVVVAAPLAYFAMDRWLETFAYAAPMAWWAFAASGIAALAIALLTVSYQSIRAAVANPVDALRYE